MPRIFVEFSKMQQLCTRFENASSNIKSIRADFKSTTQQLDWDIKFQSNINSSANQIALKLERYSQVLKKYKQFIESAQLSYRKLDNERFDNNIVNMSSLIEPENGGKDFIFNWFNNITIDKSYIIPGLLLIISTITKHLFLVGGVSYGGTTSGESSATSANAGWLGIEYADGNPGVTAWIGKASAEAQNDLGFAGVNVYLGKAEAEATAETGLMKSSFKKKYQDGEWTEKETFDLLFAEAGVGATVSAVAGDAKASVGNDMLGLEAKADGTVGNATAEAKGEFSIGEDGVNSVASGKAMISAAEGKVSGTINILGIEITGKIGGYAGAAGVEGKIGIEDNKWVMEAGAAALLGVKGGIEIGLNDGGWSNFVDFITFWD